MLQPPSGNTDTPQQKPWKIVVLYDDRPACHRAVSTLAKLLPEHARDRGMESIAWPFADLEQPDHYANMTENVRGADLIVVAPGGEEPVPMEMVEWLGRTLANRPRVPSVITVCDPAAEARAMGDVSAALLRRIAVSAGLVATNEYASVSR
jgi:hypothetical protein